MDDEDNEEELGDEAMMALDQSLASLFAEQKLRIQARQEEKNKVQKEKQLRRDFQIRVSVQVVAGHPELALRELTPSLLAVGSRPDRGAGDQAARAPPDPRAT